MTEINVFLKSIGFILKISFKYQFRDILYFFTSSKKISTKLLEILDRIYVELSDICIEKSYRVSYSQLKLHKINPNQNRINLNEYRKVFYERFKCRPRIIFTLDIRNSLNLPLLIIIII